MLDLGVVLRLLSRRNIEPRPLQRGRALRGLDFDMLLLSPGARHPGGELAAALFQRLDFSLPGEQPGVLRFGRMEADGMAGELVSFTIHQHRSRGERFPRSAIRRSFHGDHSGQPVAQRPGHRRIGGVDLGRERQSRGRGRRPARAAVEHARLDRRTVGEHRRES